MIFLPKNPHLMRNYQSFLLFLLLAIASYSCTNSSNNNIVTEIKPGFENYITGFTSGKQLSTTSSFVIRFQKNVNDTIKAGDQVLEKSFEFDPKIKGKTIWINSRSMKFVPDEALKSASIYSIKFHLENFMDVPKEFQILEYQIRTIDQSFRFADNGLSTYDNNMVLLKYKASVITADAADNKSVEEMLTASLSSYKLAPKWEHEQNGRYHHFTIDSIERKEQNNKLIIKLNGESIGVNANSDFKQRIPGVNVFEVINVRAQSGKNQYVLISFSDPLMKSQKLKGLIYFKNNHYLKYDIEGSKIKVFTSRKMKGEQELHITAGIKNAVGYQLKREFIFPVSFETNKPALEKLGSGVILPSSKGLIFPFKAVSLKMVDLKIVQIFEDNVMDFLQGNEYSSTPGSIRLSGRLIKQVRLDLGKMAAADLNKWNTFKIDLANYIDLQPGAIYQVNLSFRQAYSVYPCDSNPAKISSNDEYAMEVAHNMKSYDKNRYYYYDDYYDEYEYYDDYDYSQRENPCNSNYYRYRYGNHSITQNLYASNLGIIAKGSPSNRYSIAVSDLTSTDPVKGAKVLFYNLQKQLIAESTTNNLGICVEQLHSKPYFVVAQKDNERIYLKLDNSDALSMSNFNVAGMTVQQGLKGFLYGERGVWRPGDPIYLSFILEDIENQLPADYPLVFDLINPMGQTLVHRINKQGENGFYSFHTSTATDAPTGNWTAKITVGGAVFSRRIRIETIKPNRIKATLEFNTDLLTRSRIKTPIGITAAWLHGSPAKDLAVKVSMTLRPTKTTFEKYSQFQFLFPNTQFKPEEMEVDSSKLDAEGKTKFKLKIAALGAPGMLMANFTTRVFEKSGAFSIISQKVKFSPYKSYVGIKMASNGRDNWYKTDEVQEVNVVTVDEEGKPIQRQNVKVRLYKISWRWWWNSYNDDLASYVTSTYKKPVSVQYVNTKPNGLASFNIKINYRSYEDNGRYLIVAEDPISGHQTGKVVYFSKWYGRLGGGAVGANMLSFNSDKDKYLVGETANISIPSSKNGRALISIESGAKVIDLFWVKTEENETKFSFPITDEMAPNVFINISLIQPHAQTINDNPIRMYGVIPIEVEDPNSRLLPKISMKDALKPEKEFELTISEEKGRAMTYTLAIVDEGLLDITNFQTPDPWSRFNAREALGIRSWDMYDQVVGAYGARLEKAFAIGGDGTLKNPSKNKANRFKPVVLFAGPFTLDQGDSKKHKFKMPNYIGSVRVMVIAGDNGAYGNAEKAVAVKEDLMLLATLPRVLGPSEEVVLPVTLFAMSKNIKKVSVSLKTNDKLQVVGSKTNTIIFKKTGEQMVYFRLKVRKELGKATAHIVATSGNHKAHYDIELDIRTPNQLAINISDALVEKATTWDASYSAMGVKNTNSVVLEVSGIPSMGLERRLEELIGYPHGCIEQTTSKVLPQLFLPDLVKLNTQERSELESNIMAGLNKLLTFQTSSGGFSYWPGNAYNNNWGTSYAGYLMILAEQKAYQLPVHLKDNWLSFQRLSAQTWRDRGYYGDQLNQAYRLYTLALAGKPEMGAMNRLNQSSNLNSRSRLMLALAYAEVGQKKMAKKLLQSISLNHVAKTDYYHDYTYGSSTRDEAIRLMLLHKLGEKEQAFELVKRISAKLDSRSWLSTQTMAFSLAAISQYYHGQKPDVIRFSYTWNGKKENVESHNFVFKQRLSSANAEHMKLHFNNESNGALYVRLVKKGIPLEGQEQNRSDNLKMTVRYVDMSGNSINPSRIQQGTDFKAIVELNNPAYYGDYQNMALSQIFPSGWEILNTRLTGQLNESSSADYMDIRDDRVYTYFGIKKTTKRYIVYLNASYEGRFYLPAVRCNAMYENAIGATLKGQWVEVFK